MGNAAEDRVLAMMQARGWRLLQRHYRSPGRGGGEIDLIMRDPAGVLVFVEVRQRSRPDWGGGLGQRDPGQAAAHHLGGTPFSGALVR